MTHRPSLHYVQLKGYPILRQLQLEESLLRADDRNWCLLNDGSPPAIVLGISGNVDKLVNTESLETSPIPLIRRFSGGGTVVVDDNTLFATLIINSGALPAVESYPEPILTWTEQLYKPLLPQGDFQRRENDYAIGSRKFGGNAQYLCRQRWLHHSSLLWDYDESLMDYLLLPEKQPRYREGRTHSDFICRLRPHFSRRESVFEGLLEQLSKQFELRASSEQDACQALERPHRQSTRVENTW